MSQSLDELMEHRFTLAGPLCIHCGIHSSEINKALDEKRRRLPPVTDEEAAWFDRLVSAMGSRSPED